MAHEILVDSQVTLAADLSGLRVVQVDPFPELQLDICLRAFRSVVIVNIDIIGTVSVKVIIPWSRNVHSEEWFFEYLAFLPPHHIVIAEPFHEQFDSTLPADFEDHALVGSLVHIRISPLF